MQAPSPTSIAVASGKVFPGHWVNQWNDCFKDGETCFLSCCCPCIQFAKNYAATSNPFPVINPQAAVSQNMGTVCCAGCFYLVVAYFTGGVGCAVMGCLNRGNLRAKYNINQGECSDGCSDCLIHCFCHPCGLAQEWLELIYRADQPLMQLAVPGTVVMASPAVQPVVYAQPQPVVYAQAPVMYAAPPQPQYVVAQPQYVQTVQPVVYGQPQYATVQPQYGQPMAR